MTIKNKFLKIFLSSLLLFICLINFPVNATIKFPDPTEYKYVNDYVGILNKNDVESIVSIGKELEDKTGAQAVVVIINSTENIPIENYANNLFRTWGIGQKNKDNGLLLLVSLNDKKWRVEVGRGLEGAVPDALSNNIMTEIAKPNFSQGNYNTGIVESYSTISDYIAKEYNITLDKSLKVQLPNSNQTSRKGYGGMAGGIFLILFIIDMLLNRGRISSSLLNLIFLSNFFRGPRNFGGGSGGGFGGFGGGSSNGGGSSGDW